MIGPSVDYYAAYRARGLTALLTLHLPVNTFADTSRSASTSPSPSPSATPIPSSSSIPALFAGSAALSAAWLHAAASVLASASPGAVHVTVHCASLAALLRCVRGVGSIPPLPVPRRKITGSRLAGKRCFCVLEIMNQQCDVCSFQKSFRDFRPLSRA